MGYREVVKLCQEALDILNEDEGIREQESRQPAGSNNYPEHVGAEDLSEFQSVKAFLSETDRMISEVSRLMRKYEAMGDVEDLPLAALAEGVNSFTSATREKLNRG